MNKILLTIRIILSFLYPHFEIIPFTARKTKSKGEGFHYNDKEFVHHSGIFVEESAFQKFSPLQLLFVLSGFFITALLLLTNWTTALRFLITVLTVFYFADLFFNLFLIMLSLHHSREITVTRSQLDRLKDKDCPLYTVLCPLYKETAVIPQFISAMNRLNYPKNKLQILLLLEEDDLESIELLEEYCLPAYFQLLVVPQTLPKTKPKALNYGLKYARGKYTVVYDAEDIPQKDQIRKAVLAFNKTGQETICLQAKLSFYNLRQNILTRIFSAEYSLWFGLILTGLQKLNSLIPLGGTSNHFKTKFLKKIGCWDAFNVTEDCDLGIRLVEKGYRTVILDSITYEEANSNLSNWFHQRTRWLKGYMQTYFVHMRRTPRLFNFRKGFHILALQLVIGGKVLSMFVNQVFWLITLIYFLFRPLFSAFIESLFPQPIFYMAVFSLVFGNFLYMYYYMIACSKKGDDDLVKYVFFVPFYWLGMSLAAWISLKQFIFKPFFWKKTDHGLHLNKVNIMHQIRTVLGHDLVDLNLISTKK